LFRLVLLSWSLGRPVQQNLRLLVFFFLVIFLVIGSGSGTGFALRSGLAILQHPLLDLLRLFLFRSKQLLPFVQMVEEGQIGVARDLSTRVLQHRIEYFPTMFQILL
jgi:hypothetical protein